MLFTKDEMSHNLWGFAWEMGWEVSNGLRSWSIPRPIGEFWPHAVVRTSHPSAQPWQGLTFCISSSKDLTHSMPSLSLRFMTPKSKSPVLNSLTGTKLHVVKLVISFFFFFPSGLSNSRYPKPNTLTSLNCVFTLTVWVNFLTTYSCPCYKPQTPSNPLCISWFYFLIIFSVYTTPLVQVPNYSRIL